MVIRQFKSASGQYPLIIHIRNYTQNIDLNGKRTI